MTIALFAGAVGGRLRPALGDCDECRPQNTLADGVARLDHLGDGAGRHRFIWHLVHGLMEVGIKFLALGIEAAHAVLDECLLQLTFGELDTFDETLQRAVGGCACLGPDRVERAGQMIGDVEDLAGEGGDAISARVGRLALGALAHVLDFGGGAQIAIAQVRHLLLQHGDRIVLVRGFHGHAFGSLVGASGFVIHRMKAPEISRDATGYQGAAAENQVSRREPCSPRGRCSRPWE